MRHRKSRLQLNRFTSWRKATLKSLARNLLFYQSIKTTLQKAKAVQPLVDKLISLARSNTLFAKRQAFKILGSHKLVVLLFNEIGPRFSKSAQGGYTRIIKLAARRGDTAQIVILELTEIKKKEARKPKKDKRAPKPQEEKKELDGQVASEEKKKTGEVAPAVKEKPPLTQKPAKKFLGGLRNIFRKKSDSL